MDYFDTNAYYFHYFSHYPNIMLNQNVLDVLNGFYKQYNVLALDFLKETSISVLWGNFSYYGITANKILQKRGLKKWFSEQY